jgi:hypothetical protein
MIKRFVKGRYYRIEDEGIYFVLRIDKNNKEGYEMVYFKHVAGVGRSIDIDAIREIYGIDMDNGWNLRAWLESATEIKKKDLVLEILKESE